jgi:hypothetical protein
MKIKFENALLVTFLMLAYACSENDPSTPNGNNNGGNGNNNGCLGDHLR